MPQFKEGKKSRRRPGANAMRRSSSAPLDQEGLRFSAADFLTWLGLGNRGPCNPNPRFLSDDELWSARSRPSTGR